MQVPTTQTILDTHKELKDLRLQINGLKSEKEEVLKTVQQAQEGLNDVQNKKDEIENFVSILISLIEEVLTTAKDSIVKGNELIRESREVASISLNEIKILNNKIESSKIELEDTVKKCKIEHENIVKENEVLEFTRKDLNIYKSRLEKIISENNIDMKIL